MLQSLLSGSLDAGMLAAIGAGFISLVAVLFAMRSALQGPDAVLDRLSPAERGRAAGGAAAPTRGVVKVMRGELLAASGGEDEPKLNRDLIHAGLRYRSAVQVFLGAKVVLALLLPVAYYLSGVGDDLEVQSSIALGIVLAIGGFFGPNMWLSARIGARQKEIEHALPDTMDLLVTCVEAGLGLDAALSRIADEMGVSAPLIAGELKTTFLEMSAGIPRPEAFRRLANRTGVDDLRGLAAALSQAEVFGTSIAAALRTRAEWMRVRRMQRAEERAAVVSVKLTIPLVLFILPSLISIVIGPAAVRIATDVLPKLGN